RRTPRRGKEGHRRRHPRRLRRSHGGRIRRQDHAPDRQAAENEARRPRRNGSHSRYLQGRARPGIASRSRNAADGRSLVGRKEFAMTDDTRTVEKAHVAETSEEPKLPGHETELHPKPEWEPRYPGSGRLKGKVAIVTGSDSGIGRATAVLFAREGAKVAVAYLEEHDDARITAEAIENEGSEALIFAGDLGDPDVAKQLVEAVIGKWGQLDVLVNNAGEQH